MSKKNLSPFEEKVRSWASHTKTAMRLAREITEEAIQFMFDNDGDVTYAQIFLDAMPANYSRSNAFIKWLCDNSPALIKDGKFFKDKGDDAVAYNLERANDKPYWEYTPQPELVFYDYTKPAAACLAALKKFGNTEKFGAKDDAAALSVSQLTRLITEHVAALTVAAKTAGTVTVAKVADIVRPPEGSTEEDMVETTPEPVITNEEAAAYDAGSPLPAIG